MNTNTSTSPDGSPLAGLAVQLIRRGLPADYSQRAASEIADHYCDLVNELQFAGMTGPQAAIEAENRLGDERTLVKRTVREYQRRYWCARWPLLTFFLAPIPMLIAAWYAFGLAVYLVVIASSKLGLTPTSDPDTMFIALPVEVKYATLSAMFLIVPASVMYGYARLARRAALGWQWIVLVACILGLCTSAWKWERIGPGSRIKMYDRQTLNELEQPPQPDFVLVLGMPVVGESWTWSAFHRWFLARPVQLCQTLLPAAMSAALLFRWRRLALRTERLTVAGC
jgi:hypothetical protein